MKKIFSLFLFTAFLLVIQNLCLASDYSFELYKTPQNPGFFMVKFYPNSNAKILNIETIFVENFSFKNIFSRNKNETQQYEAIKNIIRELGLKIITKKQFLALNKNKDLSNNSSQKRFIFLGKKYQNYDSFTINNKRQNSANEDFENFLNKKIKPVIMTDLSVSHGGNIHSVVIDETKFLTGSPVLIVGKFKTAQKTLLSIKGIINEGEITLQTPLELDKDISITIDELTPILPEIWEYIYKKQQTKINKNNSPFISLAAKKGTSSWSLSILNSFPYIVIFLSLTFLAIGAAFIKRKNHLKSIININFFKSKETASARLKKRKPPSTKTPKKPSTKIPKIPENPPFELVKK